MSKALQVGEVLAETSEYLCKEVIWDRAVNVIIDRVEWAAIPRPGSSSKDRRAVMYFRGKDKPHVLNRGRLKFLARAYGGDTAQWAGKPVMLYASCKAKKNHMDGSFGRIDMAIGDAFCYEPPPRKPKPNGRQSQPQQPAQARHDEPPEGTQLPYSDDYPEAEAS
jgi:hypothetical protein